MNHSPPHQLRDCDELMSELWMRLNMKAVVVELISGQPTTIGHCRLFNIQIYQIKCKHNPFKQPDNLGLHIRLFINEQQKNERRENKENICWQNQIESEPK